MILARHTLLVAALAPLVGAHAATSDKGLPSAGSSLALSPTPAGYEVSFDVGTDQNYTRVDVKSTDLKLTAEVLKTESPPEKVKRVIVRLIGGRYHLSPYPLTIVADHVLVQGNKRIREQVERDIWLQIPAASLDPPQTLSINRVCWSVVGSRCQLQSVIATQPQLWESTQRAWLTGIKLSQKGDTDTGGEPAGTIQAGAKEVKDIVPGGDSPRLQLDSNYKLSGEFPLGSSKGKLLIQANQLSAPVALDFEIHTRTTRWLLLVGLALGLLLGWLTRGFLKGRLELNQEKQKTFALLDLIESAKAHTEDHAIGMRLDELVQRLNTAAVSKTIDTVKNDTSAVERDFTKLQEESRSRRAQIDQSYNDALAVIDTRWRLSATMQGSLAKARALLHAQAAARAKNNYTEEETVLETSLRDLLQEARPEVERYATARAALEALAITLKPLMDRVGASVLDSLTKPPDKPKTTLTPQKPEAMIEALRANLEYLYLARAYVADMFANVQILLTSQFKTWNQQLTHAHLPQGELWAEWLEQANAFIEKLEEVSRHDGAKTAGLEAEAADLIAHLKLALQSQLKASDPRQQLDAMLTASAFGDAVSLVEEVTRPRINVRLLESTSFVKSAVAPTGLVDWRGPPRHSGQVMVTRWKAELPSVASSLVAPPPPDISSLAVLAAASRRSIGTIGGLLNLVYAAIIIAGGYFLFADKWVGTLLDFMIAFFWAYATDIGADAATTAVKSVKR